MYSEPKDWQAVELMSFSSISSLSSQDLFEKELRKCSNIVDENEIIRKRGKKHQKTIPISL